MNRLMSWALFPAVFAGWFCFTSISLAQSLPVLSTSADHIVDPTGQPVVLKGCNLGNDLMLESWMLGGCIQQHGANYHDQATVFRVLDKRFGHDRFEELMRTYRNGYITSRDFDLIKSFGFNAVRLPFDYRLIQDDASPPKIRPNAFETIDHVLEMAEAAQVYVILDLHGTPGGQSPEDHTGEAGQNHLWKNEQNKQRTVAIWQALSQHYKNRSIVAAYDLINEPYGDHRTDERGELAELMPRIARAIRAGGDQHIIFFAGALNGGIVFYGDPHAQKLTNIAFTEHFYPGLFGSKAALETQARVLNLELPTKDAYLKKIGAPYFVGEFNVVFESEDVARTMRAYYDRFAEYGWAGTMWSYKLLKPAAGTGPNVWYMVTNAQALPQLDLDSSSYEDFENFFKSFATMPLAVNEPLRDAMTAAQPAPLYLSQGELPPTTAPSTPQSNPTGYTSVDLGGAIPGHTSVQADGSVIVLGGGTDINGDTDAARFVSQPTQSPVDVRATITSMLDTNEYAKAGVMARWGEGASAGMAMVNVFPSGTVALMSRPTTGGNTTEVTALAGQLPIELRLQVNHGQAVGTFRTSGGDWQTIGTAKAPTGENCRSGLAVCAHVDAVLTRVHAYLGDAADSALTASHKDVRETAENSLLQNGSFEEAGSQPELAAHWDRWGDWMNREPSWKPTHSGAALIGYHHWQIAQAGNSGLWQDVKVEPGKQYTFSIFAQRDEPEAGAQSAKTLEMRLESVTPRGELVLNTQNFEVAKLPVGRAWGKVSISGTAASDTMRVLAVLTAAEADPRGGSVKLDDASLVLAGDHQFAPAPSMTISIPPNAPAAEAPAASEETIVPPDVEAHRDLTYLTLPNHTDVKLDLYIPRGKGPFPLIIWIHGGAWTLGNKAGYPHMNFALREGFAVANLDYRLSQVAPFPAQIDDCMAALDFLVQNAEQYRLDADRIAATGESAGGHLAALLGIHRSGGSDQSAQGKIRAVIDLFGPTNLTALYANPDLRQPIDRLLGGPLDQQSAMAKQASPFTFVDKNCPPFLILHGSDDGLVPMAQSTTFAEALKSAGVDVEMMSLAGASHGGPQFWTSSMRAKMIEFLRQKMNIAM